MKLLLVTDAYPPEIRSASHLMQELAEELRDRDHRVSVATCYPSYNLAEGRGDKRFEPVSREDGIVVLRVKSLPHHKVNFLIRGISQLSLPTLFEHHIHRYLQNGPFDGVVVYSPPLPLWRTGWNVKKAGGARFVLNIQDIFPQNAIDLGALRHAFLIRFFERMEGAAYRAADHVTVHSEGNARFLLKKGRIQPGKLSVLHNWVSVGKPPCGERPLIFRRKWGLEDRFIFFFGGVMGPSQGLELVIEAARMLQTIPDVAFLLVGDGARKESLESLVRKQGIQNVVFQPFVDKKDYERLLREVDVGLVSLTSQNKTPVVPGKILGYMAAGLPVLALLHKESDGHLIVRDAGCGYTAVSDSVDRAVDIMRRMYFDRAALPGIGSKGYHYAARHFSKTVVVDKLEALLRA